MQNLFRIKKQLSGGAGCILGVHVGQPRPLCLTGIVPTRINKWADQRVCVFGLRGFFQFPCGGRPRMRTEFLPRGLCTYFGPKTLPFSMPCRGLGVLIMTKHRQGCMGGKVKNMLAYIRGSWRVWGLCPDIIEGRNRESTYPR